jgi:hypothetical protein
MKDEKCIFYLVNGLNVPLTNVMKIGDTFTGINKEGKKTKFLSGEINAIEGDYKETVTHVINQRGCITRRKF